MGVWYCTREEVQEALDFKDTTRNSRVVDRAIGAASISINGQLRRVFYPTLTTRYKDWPNWQYAYPWRIWLDADELISVNTLISGGMVIQPGDYNLEPSSVGPPYTYIEMSLAASSMFSAGAETWQRSISVYGLFGFNADENPGGSLSVAVSDTTGTSITVTDSGAIGIGSLIRIDAERMIVSAKSMVDTGQTLQVGVTASASGVTIAVTDGTAYNVNEVLLIDAERMLIVDIAGDNLIVKRAWSGSVLAVHSMGADIYVGRLLTVSRGQLGTTASTHLVNAPVATQAYPPLINQLAVAESVNTLTETRAGYSRQGRSTGTVAIEAQSQGLTDLRAQAFSSLGRQSRSRAI